MTGLGTARWSRQAFQMWASVRTPVPGKGERRLLVSPHGAVTHPDPSSLSVSAAPSCSLAVPKKLVALTSIFPPCSGLSLHVGDAWGPRLQPW